MEKIAQTKQIRKAKPARMSITIFGSDFGGKPEKVLGKSLAEGDGRMEISAAGQSMAPEVETLSFDAIQGDVKPAPNVDESGIKISEGYPPRGIPQHGPGFLSLGKEEQDWVRSTHGKMGHPDPQRFARFLKTTHASPTVIAGALDFQCDACIESQRGFQLSRPAAIHDDLGFNEVLGMDMAFWKGKNGVSHGFVHFIDEGTVSTSRSMS